MDVFGPNFKADSLAGLDVLNTNAKKLFFHVLFLSPRRPGRSGYFVSAFTFDCVYMLAQSKVKVKHEFCLLQK